MLIGKVLIVSLQFARLQTSQVNQPTGRGQGDEEQENRWIDQVDWDLVIFDEAHHLRRYLKGSKFDSDREITKSYWLGQALAERTKSLLLLTATPLQLSPYETYSLVELLDTGLFSSYSEFLSSKSQTDHIVKLDQILRSLDWDTQLDSEEVRPQLREELFGLLLDSWQPFRAHGKEYEMWDGLADCCLETASAEQKDRACSAVEPLKKSSYQVCELLDKWTIPMVDLSSFMVEAVSTKNGVTKLMYIPTIDLSSFMVEAEQPDKSLPFTRTEAEAKVGRHVCTWIVYHDIPRGTHGEVTDICELDNGYGVEVLFVWNDGTRGAMRTLSADEYARYLIDYGEVPPWEQLSHKTDMTLQEFISFVTEYPKAFPLWAERKHKLSQIMFRNRKREVLKGEFVKRKAYNPWFAYFWTRI